MKTLTFFVLAALSGVVSALPVVPVDDALAHGGFTARDAIPGYDGLAARTHEGKIDGKDLLASCPGGPGSSNVGRADRCTMVRPSLTSCPEPPNTEFCLRLSDQHCEQPRQACLEGSWRRPAQVRRLCSYIILRVLC